MLLSKLSVAAVLFTAVAVVAAGSAAFAFHAAASEPNPPAQTPAAVPPAADASADKPEVNGEEPTWGDAVDGVQVRLRPSKTAWDVGETPEFVLDVRNRGEKPHGACRVPSFCEIEWDGRWYEDGKGDLDCKTFSLQPGKEVDDWVKVTLDLPWIRKGEKDKRLEVTAGKHTVRLAFLFDADSPNLGEVPRPVSQPVEIEVGKESAWGDPDGGVQARVRIAKAAWEAGEKPTFSLDLRNQGKSTPNARRVPLDCQIEVDGTWYTNDLPSGPYPAVGDPLEPGKQVNDWTVVTPDKNWGNLAGKKDHFPLPPGKHTIRIAYPLHEGDGDIKPVSGPLEIEVGKESAWGDADGGVQARLRTPRAVWNADEAPTFILDLRTAGKAEALRIKADLQISVDGIWYWNPSDPDWRVRDVLDTDRLDLVERTTDWVSVTADQNWVIKTSGAVGKPNPLSLSPGKHTIRLSYEVGFGGKTFRPVSGPVVIEVGEESAWGDADGGIQARVRTPKAVWAANESPTFIVDLRNQGKQTPRAFPRPFDCQIEVDGTWYAYNKPVSWVGPSEPTPLEPGKQIDEWLTVSLDDGWVNKAAQPAPGPNDHLPPPPGKHTIRIAFPFNDEKPAFRPVSGPIEIEVSKEAGAKESTNDKEAPPFAEPPTSPPDAAPFQPPEPPQPPQAVLPGPAKILSKSGADQPEWGEAVDGVQARLRPTQDAWDAGAAPAFFLDARNRGKKAAESCRMDFCCEIEWDGKWYMHALPRQLDCPTSWLNPDGEIDQWVTLSLAGPWLLKTPARAARPGDDFSDKDEPLRLTPGKHTLRAAVGFSEFEFRDGAVVVGPGPDGQLGGDLGTGIRVVTAPVEIEIGGK